MPQITSSGIGGLERLGSKRCHPAKLLLAPGRTTFIGRPSLGQAHSNADTERTAALQLYSLSYIHSRKPQSTSSQTGALQDGSS